MYADKRITVNLCCEGDGSLVWTRAQRALTLVPSSQQNGCLTLSNVNKQSSGKYTCRASNEFGFAEATTEVIYTGCHFSFFLKATTSEKLSFFGL